MGLRKPPREKARLRFRRAVCREPRASAGRASPLRIAGGRIEPRSRDPRRGLMKEETPIGKFYNRLQSNGFQWEFLKRHGGTEEVLKGSSPSVLKPLGIMPTVKNAIRLERGRTL